MSQELIRMALSEDVGDGDVTAEYFVPEERVAKAFMVSRSAGILSGIEMAKDVFLMIDPELKIEILIQNGIKLEAGTSVLSVEGKARSILTAERTALNFVQRLSGIATLTSQYAALVAHTQVKILDTRKTTPGYRLLEKKAVLDGGGMNHRMGLYDRAMVKDNHLAAEGGVVALQKAIDLLKKDKPFVQVELEADHLDQVAAFLELQGVDYILLDNMSCSELRQAVKMRGTKSHIRLEASGGVNLSTLSAIAETGVDFISVGALTHSAVSLDLGLDFLTHE